MDIRIKQRAVVEALEDVKGRDIVVFNTEAMPSMFERVIIASGESSRQVKALADRVCERIKGLGSRVLGVEGDSNADWVLVDLGEIVVHIMHHAARAHYNLEELWGVKPVKVKAAAPAKKAAVKKKPAKAAPAARRAAAKKPARAGVKTRATKKAPAAKKAPARRKRAPARKSDA